MDTTATVKTEQRATTKMPSNVIKLLSADGETFEVDKDSISASSTIKNMIEMVDDIDDEPIPIANISSGILRRIIAWANHHKNDKVEVEREETRDKRSDDIGTWDVEFLKVDQGTLFELLAAANYLGIDGLLDSACKTVANQIKGKLPEEIRRTFNIQNDFTPDEEEQVRHENEWVEEK